MSAPDRQSEYVALMQDAAGLARACIQDLGKEDVLGGEKTLGAVTPFRPAGGAVA